jgi:hypothetical protein
MSLPPVVVDAPFLLLGGFMLWASITRSPLWMVRETKWWWFDSRQFIKRVFGDRVLRLFGIIVGSTMMLLAGYEAVMSLVRR